MNEKRNAQANETEAIPNFLDTKKKEKKQFANSKSKVKGKKNEKIS